MSDEGFSVQPQLEQLLRGHDLPTQSYQEWLIVGDQLPAIRGYVYITDQHPDNVTVRLEVEVLLEGSRQILECFAGFGRTENEAAANALQNFCINSFHVLLAALWEKVDPDQVTRERWGIGGRWWLATIGNFGVRSFGGQAVEMPDGVFEAIESLVHGRELSAQMHWVRMFFCNVKADQQVSEFLFDNETWGAAEAAISALPWKKLDTYYSIRCFLILQPES